MSRLMQQQTRKTTTEFSGKFSIFEALYELEISANQTSAKETT